MYVCLYAFGVKKAVGQSACARALVHLRKNMAVHLRCNSRMHRRHGAPLWLGFAATGLLLQRKKHLHSIVRLHQVGYCIDKCLALESRVA